MMCTVLCPFKAQMVVTRLQLLVENGHSIIINNKDLCCQLALNLYVPGHNFLTKMRNSNQL